MLAMLISTLFFTLLMWIGNILMFLDTTAYTIVFWFLMGMLLCSLLYKKANCHPIEIIDFTITLSLTAFFLFVLSYYGVVIQPITFWYMYLSTFLSLLLYANSIRFKSLM